MFADYPAWFVLFHDVADPYGSFQPGAADTAPHVNIVEALDGRTGQYLGAIEDTFTPLPPRAGGHSPLRGR